MRKFLSLILFFSASAVANDWSIPTELGQINTGYKGGMILFKTTGKHHNPNSSCNAHYYSVKSDTANVNHILSVLLAAQRSGAKIQVGVNSNTCSSDANKYIVVSRVKIHR